MHPLGAVAATQVDATGQVANSQLRGHGLLCRGDDSHKAGGVASTTTSRGARPQPHSQPMSGCRFLRAVAAAGAVLAASASDTGPSLLMTAPLLTVLLLTALRLTAPLLAALLLAAPGFLTDDLVAGLSAPGWFRPGVAGVPPGLNASAYTEGVPCEPPCTGDPATRGGVLTSESDSDSDVSEATLDRTTSSTSSLTRANASASVDARPF